MVKKILIENISLIEGTIQDILNSTHDYATLEKVVQTKYDSETITDLELPLSKYTSIEEYIDVFVDWIYEISQDIPSEESITFEGLFKQFIQSDQYFDFLKDVISDPEVQKDIIAAENVSEDE